ncbi:MAG TPA: ABC transporter permease [Actinomycetota bacterium]|nr:ABC transporter permease [Actinomycetota bacterium]
MRRFLLRRLALALVTLFLLSIIVFLLAQVLPGDVARRILGPFADQRAVTALNKELGADRPLVVRYGTWVGGFVQGDLGESASTRQPVWEVIKPALFNSAKLAALAFVLVVPLGILGGVIAALREGRLTDRLISIGGLSATATPEFVWAVVVILVLALWLKILPVTAAFPAGSGPLVQIRYLLLPAICLVFVLFGYIARMARAGTIEALGADYTRTAILKGLSQRKVLTHHVLRNSLLPTIAVIATQAGYLIGGLVVLEVIFNYQGIGQVVFRAAEQKDFPLLQSAVLLVGLVYLLATLAADILYSILNPRIRLQGES